MNLNDIAFGYRVSSDQSDLISRNHVRYEVTLGVNECDNFRVKYQCNKNSVPKVKDVLECLFHDADAYECSRDILDFAFEYGFNRNEYDKCVRAYNTCRDAYMWFQTEWRAEEFQEIHDLIFDYESCF